MKNTKIVAWFVVLSMLVPFVLGGTVTRSLSSSSVGYGGDLEVTLVVEPSGNSLVIDEIYPSEWKVKENGDNFNTQTPGHLKLVELSPSSKSYRYTLTAPSFSGTGSFLGTYQFNDEKSETDIAGAKKVSVEAKSQSVCTLNQWVCESDDLIKKQCNQEGTGYVSGSEYDCDDDGKVCDNGACVEPLKSCSKNTDCSENEYCSDGLCVSQPQAPATEVDKVIAKISDILKEKDGGSTTTLEKLAAIASQLYNFFK